jgi:phosphate transport system permease protein
MTAVPNSQREAVLALGATRWEMIRIGVLRNSRIGIVGAVMLGLGRALGETMAVTMVIGNHPDISKSPLRAGLYAGQRDRQRVLRGDRRSSTSAR